MLQKVNSSDHNGVPTYWLDGQGGMCIGTLIFRVGLRDEPVTLAGITHLVEHLILRQVEPVTIRNGGRVDTNTLEFHASGRPEAVADFFNRVAGAISDIADLTEEDLALEKALIEAENPRVFRHLTEGLLTYRFGARGPGLSQIGAPTISAIGLDEVVDWAKSRLSSANAAFTFTGPVPDALDFRLPSGGAAVWDQPVPLITEPTLVMSQKIGVALSLVVPLRYGALLSEALRNELWTRLSHDQGLIYSVGLITTVLDDESLQLELVLDPIEENTSKALRNAVEAVNEVARFGFSEYAVESSRNECIAELAWDENVPMFYLDQVAVDRLLQMETHSREELVRLAETTDSAALTEILKACLRTLVVAVDSDVSIKKRDIKAMGLAVDAFEIWQDDAAPHSPLDGTTEAPKVWRNRSNNSVLQLTETHLLKHRKSGMKSIKLPDIVLVGERSDGGIALLDSRGRSAEIEVNHWKNSKKLRRALLEVFPAEIIRPFPKAH